MVLGRRRRANRNRQLARPTKWSGYGVGVGNGPNDLLHVSHAGISELLLLSGVPLVARGRRAVAAVTTGTIGIVREPSRVITQADSPQLGLPLRSIWTGLFGGRWRTIEIGYRTSRAGLGGVEFRSEGRQWPTAMDRRKRSEY